MVSWLFLFSYKRKDMILTENLNLKKLNEQCTTNKA